MNRLTHVLGLLACVIGAPALAEEPTVEAQVASIQERLAGLETLERAAHVALITEAWRVAMSLEARAENEQANQLVHAVLTRMEEVHGTDSQIMERAADLVAAHYWRMAQYVEASAYTERALAQAVRIHGDEARHFDLCIRAARLAAMQGRQQRADQLIDRAIVASRSYGADDARQLAAMAFRVSLLMQRADLGGAATAVAEARHTMEELQLQDTSEGIDLRLTEVEVLAATRQLEAAERRIEEVLASDIPGPLLRVRALGQGAALARQQGELERAVERLDAALALAETTNTSGMAFQRARLRQEQAQLRYALGQPEAGRALATAVVDDFRVRTGAVSPNTLSATMTATNTMARHGDSQAARLLMARTVSDALARLPPGHPTRLMVLAGQANLLGFLQEVDALEELVGRLRAELHHEGVPDELRVRVLGMSGGAFILVGRPELAAELLEEALAASTPQNEPAVRANLAGAYWYLGRTEEMLENAERSFQLMPNRAACINLALAYQDQGRSEEARTLLDERCLPESDPLNDSTHFAAVIAELAGDRERAMAMSQRSLDAAHQRLEVVSVLPHSDAMGLLEGSRRTLDLYLALETDVAAAYAEVLRWKGLATRSAERRRLSSQLRPEDAELARALKTLERRLAFVDLEGGVRDPALEAERRALELELSQRHGGVDLGAPTLAELCTGLGREGVLVDVLRTRTTRRRPYRYLAFVLDGADCSLERVELGEAAPLEEAVDSWRAALADPVSTASRQRLLGEDVASQLWEPLLPHVDDRETVWVVPDAVLALVPLGALPARDGTFLLEERQISYLSRADRLLRPAPTRPRSLMLVGDVDYGEPTGAVESTGLRGGCHPEDLPPLPGTKAEVEAIASGWKRRDRSLLTGTAASELAVRDALASFDIVHLATHGYVSDRCGGATIDPFLRSGVALAGANDTPTEDSDGLLTAAEVTQLDLGSTELVVLSACDTGLGEPRSGQGVLGLRQAFAIAGAGTVVMSLWSVDDNANVALMKPLYQALRKGLPPQQALRQAQRAVLEAAREEYGWAAPSRWAGFIADGPG